MQTAAGVTVRPALKGELTSVARLLAEVFQREHCTGPFSWVQMKAINREIFTVSGTGAAS